MKIIEIETGVDGYADVIKHVLASGVLRSPRGHVTLDSGPTTVIIHDVTASLPLGVGRGLNRRIAAVEAAQLVGGFADEELVVKASPNFKRFLEPSGRFYGSYGRRVGDQVPAVIEKLTTDRDTRQAVITLWYPQLDNEPNKRDYPCTVALIFALINDRLELNVTMRSQDVWLGAPYDWFQFTQLQQTVARQLAVKSGVYRHSTVSTHLYGGNFSDAERLAEAPDPDVREAQPRGFYGTTIYKAMLRAYELSHLPMQELGEMNTSEKWYAAQFATLLG